MKQKLIELIENFFESDFWDCISPFVYIILVAYTIISFGIGYTESYKSRCSVTHLITYVNIPYHAGCLAGHRLPDLYWGQE